MLAVLWANALTLAADEHAHAGMRSIYTRHHLPPAFLSFRVPTVWTMHTAGAAVRDGGEWCIPARTRRPAYAGISRVLCLRGGGVRGGSPMSVQAEGMREGRGGFVEWSVDGLHDTELLAR